MSIARRRFVAGGAALPFAWSSIAHAAPTAPAWPARPVKILVGFPAGQGSDVVARIFADDLQKTLATPFVIDNRPGAGALLAASAVAKSPPDGHTLLFTSSGPFTISPHLYKMDFDSATDLEGIALLGTSPTLLLVNHDFPAKSVADLVRMSRDQELDCGSSGYGITDHLTLEMLKLHSGARLKHVPYKGSIASLTDLVGGRLQAVFASSTSSNAFVKAGKVRVLAVASLDRWKVMPEVPAISETYAGFEAISWAMMAVPKGVAPPLRERITQALNGSLATPAIVQALATAGLEATPGTTPAAARAYALAEYEKWGEVIRKANIRIE